MPSTLSALFANRARGTALRAASPSGVEPKSATARAVAESTSGSLRIPGYRHRRLRPRVEGRRYHHCMAWCENLIEAAGMKPGERVLVVVDEPLTAEGAELAAAVRDAGGEPRLELWAGERPLANAPPGVLAGGAEADVSFFISEAPRGDEAGARFQLMEA